MQSMQDSQISNDEMTNKRTILLYLLVFRWLSLAYVLFSFLLQKSLFEPFNYYILFVALLYVLCLSLLQPFILEQVSQKPMLIGIDFLLCALFLILGGWPKAWFFYSLTPIIAAAIFWGSAQAFIFAAFISVIYLVSLNMGAALFINRPGLIRFDNFLFPIASFAFAAGAAILFSHQRQKGLMSLKGLRVKFSQASEELEKAEGESTNRIAEAVRGAALMISEKEPVEVLSLLVEATKKLTQAEKSAAALFDRKSGKVKIDLDTLVVRGRRDQHLESWWRQELDDMIKVFVEKESRPKTRENREESDLLADCVLRKSNENTSLICIPLKAGSKYIGILSAFNTYPYFFCDDEIKILTALADQAAVVLTDLQHPQGQSRVSDLEFEKELETITTKCLQSQEAERKRISRELHDNTAQSLTHLVMRLQKISSTLILAEQEELKDSMAKLIEIAEHTLEEVHEMAFQMRPAILEDLGLIETIRWYISHYLGTATLTVNFATLEKEVKLPPHAEIAVLRIVQEALTNIRKYAKASEAFVNLELVGDELVVTIEDNGDGFNVEKALAESAERKSLGIQGMRERTELLGGSLEIISHLGGGTKITANVPLRFRR